MMGNWPGEPFVPMPDPIVDVAVLLNPDGSLNTTFGAGGGVVSGQPPQDPLSPAIGFDPGILGDPGGGIEVLNFSTPGATSLSGPTAAVTDTPGSATPQTTSAQNSSTSGPVVTAASPTSGPNLALTQAALVVGGQAMPMTPAPGVVSAHAPTGSASTVTVGTPANGTGSSGPNPFNTGSLSGSHLTTEEPDVSPRGDDGKNLPSAEPLLEPGDLPAALRDDYFAQLPSPSPEASAPQPGNDPDAAVWAGLLALVAVPRLAEPRRGRQPAPRRQT